MSDNPKSDATRTQDPDWSDMLALEQQALHHEREAHRIRAEIRARVDDANRRGWWDTTKR